MVKGCTFFAGGSWDAGSNPGVATSIFFFLSLFFFYPLAFYCLVSLLALLASRDFCENVFLVIIIITIQSVACQEDRLHRQPCGLPLVYIFHGRKVFLVPQMSKPCFTAPLSKGLKVSVGLTVSSKRTNKNF